MLTRISSTKLLVIGSIEAMGGNWLGGLIATNTPKNWQVDTFGHEVSPYNIVADGQHLTVEGSLVWPLSETEQFHDFVGAISTADVAEIDDGWLRIFGVDGRWVP